MCFGVGAYIHYEWSSLLRASPGTEEQAGDYDMNYSWYREERRGEETKKKKRQGRTRGCGNGKKRETKSKRPKMRSDFICYGCGLNDKL